MQDYLYLEAVQFVKVVKKGALAETSPMLNDISGVPKWDKVNSGMFKMYQAEVLGKVPIMQHFLFGTIVQFPEMGSTEKSSSGSSLGGRSGGGDSGLVVDS